MTQNQYLPEEILIPFFGKKKPIIGVEIGVLGASGTVAMLNRMPNLKLYGIDPWKHFPNKAFEAERDQEWHDKNYEESKKRVKEFGDRCILLRMTSDKAVKVIKKKVDFIHIDGDHSKDQVLRDIRNWKTKLKDRAIFSGHDYQIDYIKEIVHQEFDNVKLGDDFLWWIEFNR